MATKLIILLVIVLAIIAVAQLMRVYELSNKVKGRKEEDIDLKTNNFNASLFIVFLILFFGQFIYCVFAYGRGLLPDAASEHGQAVDWLYNVNWVIVFTVFLLTNFLLFFFAYKYRWHPDRKAHFFAHDNKLELIWTLVPAVTMAFVIIFGLVTWNEITGKPSDDAKVVEIYAKQFDFTARYSGEDNKLGYSDYKLVSTHANNSNPLGVVNGKTIGWRLYELDSLVNDYRTRLHNDSIAEQAYSAANLYKMEKTMEKLDRIKERVYKMQLAYSDSVGALADDDFMAKELFLIKDQEYYFVFRSQDVIHSAYFPHFRAQMNCVPGQRTTLKFKPIYTTQEMKDKTGDPNFEYILMCNKICGVSHSNMKMSVRVGTEEEFKAWCEPDAANVTMIAGGRAEPPSVDVELRYFGEHKSGHGHEEGHGDSEEHAEGGEDNHGEEH